ncbi:MAG TPA: hypothetical protein VF042_13740 [Gemmatimonadaceae bacterium]
MHTQLTDTRDARETGVVFASSVATVLAALYWISRIGFANPVFPVAYSLGLSLFLIAAPLWMARSTAWWGSQSFLTIACVVLTMLLGMVAESTGLNAIPIIALGGVLLAAITLLRWLGKGTPARSLLFVFGVCVFAVWCAGVIWGSRYKMPLFWETMSYKANIHHDTFYYASMANMMDTYGVPSTGLDGIPLVRYHYGSAWLFDQWSHLLGIDVLTFYSLGYPLIVLPLFFAALLQLSVELGAKLRNDWMGWILFLAATVGFIPTVALNALAVWNSNAFISESYLMGMPVFFLTLATAVAFYREKKAGRSALIFFILFVPLILSALGFLKISMMLLALAAGGYIALRDRLYRQPMVLLSALIALASVGITYHYVSLPAQNGGISPLHFMRYDAREGWQQFFPLIHLLWTWVYVGARLWEERIADISSLRSSLRQHKLTDVEILLLVAILGFLPGEIVSIHGGSAVYFSDVQRWLALSFILARSPVWLRVWRERRPSRDERTTESGVRGWKLSTLLMIFVAAPFVVTLFVNLAQWPVRAIRANITTRHELAQTPREATYYPIVTALRDISRLPESERKQSLLFIPQSNRQYWSMFTADGRCTYTPLIAPGIASVAMLDGMPSAGCEVTDQYNMTMYQARKRPQLPEDMSSERLCEKARAKGFKEVIVLEAPGQEIPRRRRIDCYLHTS